jgi:hypothetical protein
VTGFQDAVILFSILSHLADSPGAAAFASQDAVFSGAAVRTQICDRGVDLRVYKRLNALGDELWERVAPAIRQGWEEDFAKADEAVQANTTPIEAELLSIIDRAEIGREESAEVIQVRKATIKKPISVRTELPDSQSIPPFSAGFNRKPGLTKIEATVWVDFDATVRPYFGGLVSLLVARTMAQAAQPSEPKIEDRTISKIVDLALEAEFDGKQYGRPRLVNAVVQR